MNQDAAYALLAADSYRDARRSSANFAPIDPAWTELKDYAISGSGGGALLAGAGFSARVREIGVKLQLFCWAMGCGITGPSQMGLCWSRAAVRRGGIWQRRGWRCVRLSIFSLGVGVQSGFAGIGFIWEAHFCAVPALATPANAFGIDQAGAGPAAT